MIFITRSCSCGHKHWCNAHGCSEWGFRGTQGSWEACATLLAPQGRVGQHPHQLQVQGFENLQEKLTQTVSDSSLSQMSGVHTKAYTWLGQWRSSQKSNCGSGYILEVQIKNWIPYSHCLPLPKINTNPSNKPQETILRIFLQMKFYLPTRARQPVLTTFLGRTRLRWCFARKEPTSWACRQDPVSTAPPSSAVFPAEHTPCMVSRAPVLPGSSRTDTQLCTWNFICFSRFDARPIIVVLKCIYVVKLKPTVILAMELRISEPASWIRHWFLLLCHNVNIFGINNTFIDLHPVVPKESSSVFPAPLHSVHCQKYPSSPVERSKVSGANDEASRPCWSSVVLFVPHHYSNATAAIQKHRVQKAARVMLGSPNSGSQNKWGGHRRHSKLSPCPPLDSALSHPRSNPSSQEMPN